MSENAVKWESSFSSQVRDFDRSFTGSQEEVIRAVEELGRSRGYVVEVEGYTDQIDVFVVSHGRRRRWLILMA